MKPLNADNPSCNPISSNCVIWQGPDIPCISLCKGDSISLVVYKLATELCTLLEQTNVDNYDLECLNTGCGPSNFQQLIQILIDKICNCCDGGVTPTPSTTKELDEEVVIAPCFQYTNGTGDLVTTMTVLDYVLAIGNKVCNLVSQITTINSILAQYNIRIEALENAPPPTFTLPSVLPGCLISPSNVGVPMNIALQELITQFCLLQGATGLPIDILNSITFQCPDLTNQPQLSNSASSMGSLVGWNSTVENLSDSITNMWLTICDIRAAVNNIQQTCCPSGCEGVSVILDGYVTGTDLHLVVTGSIPSGLVQCAPGTTTFTISDQSGNTITRTGDVVTNLNNPTGLVYNLTGTGINTADNLNITATLCLNSTSGATVTCQSILQVTVFNNALCPTLTLSPSSTSIGYTGSVVAGTATYVVQLWDEFGLVLIASNTVTLTGPTTLSGSFTGLTPNTTYRVRVLVIPAAGEQYNCPPTLVTTIPSLCLAPINVSSEIIIP